MKKVIFIVGAIIISTSLSVLVFASPLADKRFDDAVYRGEKWEYDFGVPKQEILIILPQDRAQPKASGDGYVGRVEKKTKKYELVFLAK